MYAPQFSFAVGPSLLGMSSQASAQSAVLFAGHYITAIEWYKAMATIDTIQTNFVTTKTMPHGGEKYYFCRLASFSCLLTTYNGSWLAAVSKIVLLQHSPSCCGLLSLTIRFCQGAVWWRMIGLV